MWYNLHQSRDTQLFAGREDLGSSKVPESADGAWSRERRLNPVALFEKRRLRGSKSEESELQGARAQQPQSGSTTANAGVKSVLPEAGPRSLHGTAVPISVATRAAAKNMTYEVVPVSVKRTFLLCEPWPCNPAAETALQPLIWCF